MRCEQCEKKDTGVFKCCLGHPAIYFETKLCQASIVGVNTYLCSGAELGMCFVCMLKKGVLLLFITTTTAEHSALVSTKHSHYPTVY